MSTVIVEDFFAVVRGSLRGFARCRLASGMILHDVGIYQREDGTAFAIASSKAMLGRDGTAIRDAAGKIRYVPIVTFASRELQEKFSAAVIEAVRRAHPAALS